MIKLKTIIATVVMLFNASVFADEVRYMGPEGGDYLASSNWSTGNVPGEYDNAVIDNGAEVILNGESSSYWLLSNIKIGDAAPVSSSLHRLKINSGELDVFGGVIYVGSQWAGTNADGALTINGGTLYCDQHLMIGSNARGAMYVNGGKVHSTWSVSVGGTPWWTGGKPGVLFLNGGTVTTDQVFIYDTGSIIISDGVLEVGISNNVKSAVLNYIKKGLIVPAAGYKLVTCDRKWGKGLRVSAQKIEPAQMFTPGYSFTSADKIVSTVVFSWYNAAQTWQKSGPWLPLEGFDAWNGDPDWWKEQIKQIMAADIDYMWLQNWYEEPLFGLYAAYNEMRMDGYDVPKWAPYFDLAISYGAYAVDLSTAAGKDDFVNHYIMLYESYFQANPDPNADNFIAQINNKPVIAMYSPPDNGNVQNFASLTRADVESRLAAALGARHPIFNNGVYAIRAYHGDGISWADEKVKQFCGGTYLDVQSYNGVNSARIQPGYWDQNVRSPGYFLARNGGTNYIEAWNSILGNSAINHVNVESFNEYDEGSGIYAVDTVNSPYRIPSNTSNDTWSTTNDPLEYIKTTAVKASQWNSRAAKDAKIIWHNIPATMKKGETAAVTVVVRNEGDDSWTGAAGYAIAEKAGTNLLTPGSITINDANDQISFFGGIFRGRPVKFNFVVTAPQIAGTYTVHLQMKQGSTYFGEDKAITINVACSEADFTGDCKVNWSDLNVLAGNWLSSI